MTPTEPSFLDQIAVASPCQASWQGMVGDDRTRFCGDCRMNVYNLSGMSRTEAEALLGGREGRVCVRFLRRADGTVITRDCPVGLRAVRRKARLAAIRCAALLGALCTGMLGCVRKASTTDGPPPTPAIVEPPPVELMGDVCVPEPALPGAIMGKIVAPSSGPEAQAAPESPDRR